MNLNQILQNTNRDSYAVGSFSPRYTFMIQPVLQAAEACASPAIVQISQKELGLYGITPAEFAREFFAQKQQLGITVPTTLHLDHTKEFDMIAEAIEAGFESVMIDASEKSFDDNVALTLQVVNYARKFGVSVEAELGKIGANDMIETDGDDSEMYTVPSEAKVFVETTGIDALAVSVGTAHGVYTVKKPTIAYPIIRQIKQLCNVYLVLHGGSGVPAAMVKESYNLPGGISKINIATDLELAFLAAISAQQRGTNAWCASLEPSVLQIGRQAVYDEVCDKINNYLSSNGKAW